MSIVRFEMIFEKSLRVLCVCHRSYMQLFLVLFSIRWITLSFCLTHFFLYHFNINVFLLLLLLLLFEKRKVFTLSHFFFVLKLLRISYKLNAFRILCWRKWFKHWPGTFLSPKMTEITNEKLIFDIFFCCCFFHRFFLGIFGDNLS